MKKIISMLTTLVFALLLVPNNVDALYIESSDMLKEAFKEKDVTITGKTIKLNADFEDEDIYEIGGDDYILDLNGYKFTVGEFYVIDGSLTINDSKGNGFLDTLYDWFGVEEDAKLIINNGKFDYFLNSGTTVINNGTIEMVTNDGTITINDGTFGGLWQRGNGTLNGGTYTATFATSTIDLIWGTTTISGEVLFQRTEENPALVVYSQENIGKEIINKVTTDGYIATFNGYGTNSDSWYDEELGETVTQYEVTYEPVYVIKDETTEIFNKVAPNGVWTIEGSKPKDMEEAEFLLNAIADDLKLSSNYKAYAFVDSGDVFNPEVVSIYLEYTGCSGCYLNSKTVKAIYKEPSKEIKTKVNSVLDKIAKKNGENHDVETGFLLEDLYLINYLNSSTQGMNSSLALNFSKDLIALTNGGNISYKYDSRLGSFTPTGLWGYSGGQVIVYYDGIAVGTTDIGLTTSNVLYVPSDTADNDEARIAAALKRIEEYLGTKKGITITVGGTLESLNEEDYTWKDYGFIDDKTSGTNYYNVTINGKTYKFAICKKDTKDLETPAYLGSDIMSNISIKSNSTELPLDTRLSVKEVTSDSIKKVLGTNIYAAYDISLYSNAKQVNITKLENGKFIVNIPVPEILKDKEITVYYINSKNQKEEHTATVKDGIASFETDHFSTYILTEKTNIKNPATFNGVSTYILLGAISLIGLLLGTIYLKKSRAN